MKYIYLAFLTFIFATFLGTNAHAEIEKVAKPKTYTNIGEATIGTREGGLGVANGHEVSNLSMPDYNGEMVALSDLWEDKPLMLVFYRGGWCPYCNMQVKELSDEYAKFEDVGLLPVLVSVDKPDASALLTKSYEIPFPVLSDQDLAAHREFNVVLKMDEGRVESAKARGLDFAEWAGQDHSSIAVASTFLIDTDGVVQWSTVLDDYKSRPTVDQLISAYTEWQSNQHTGH